VQILLSSPAITCDHCIETIRGVVDAVDGARLISGDPEAKTYIVDLASGALLDAIAPRLAAADYPLGEISAHVGTREAQHPPLREGRGRDSEASFPRMEGEEGLEGEGLAKWRPASYRVEKTDVGANINYDCYCSCDAGFALDRSNADPAPESCCCGNQILVGVGAGKRIASKLDAPDRYRIDIQQLTMPWGQPLDVALAIPLEP